MEFQPLDLFIPGDGLNTTVQSAINAAARNPRAAVWIRASYGGTDTYTNPSNVPIFDMRGGGSISFGGGSGGGSSYASSFTGQTSYTVAGSVHGLGTADLTTAVYDSATGTRTQIVPDSVQINSTTFDVTFNFVESQDGRVVISK